MALGFYGFRTGNQSALPFGIPSPEFGITEKLSDLAGYSRNAQGGSTLSQSFAQPSNRPQASSGGQVLGTSTNAAIPGVNYSQEVVSQAPKSTPKNTGGGSGGGVPSAPDLSNPALRNQWAIDNGFDGWDAYQDMLRSAQGGADAEIASLNTEFDKNKQLAEEQLGFLSRQRDLGIQGFDQERQNLLSQIGNQKTRALADRDKNIDSAAQAARNTQAKNRNMLRALGILNSTAAGDILSRPLTEFDNTKAEYVQMAQQRTSELDDYLNAKTSELALARQELENNYGQLVSQIQNDLRFSDRERADAIRSANSALSERISQIKMAQQDWVNQVQAQKANIALQLAQIGGYNMPAYDVNQMFATQFNPGGDKYRPQQVGILDERDRLSALGR